MGIDRVFSTPTITVDQDKYDELIKIKTLYELKKGENKKMKNYKVMISQPMHGKKEEQIRKERKEIVEKLESKGWEVVDTVFTEETPKECDAAIWYLAKSINAISEVDVVLFMNGWQNARGCKIEHEICKQYERLTMYEYEI